MSSEKTSRFEAEKIREIAREYERRGYDVVTEPNRVPAFLSDLTPDLVATSEDDRVVVEVKVRRATRSDTGVQRLAERINSHPGWRLELIFVEPPREGSLSLIEVEAHLIDARKIATAGMYESALLLAWAAGEALLRLLLEREGSPVTDAVPGTVVRTAFSRGLIDRETFDVMLVASQTRNAVAHGFKPVDRIPLSRVVFSLLEAIDRCVAELSGRVLQKVIPLSADEMARWFLERYEDPVNAVPYDPEEGDYKFILGGPYDPSEVLSEKFPDADESVLQGAADQILRHGHRWVRKGQYSP